MLPSVNRRSFFELWELQWRELKSESDFSRLIFGNKVLNHGKPDNRDFTSDNSSICVRDPGSIEDN
jgi:hypothetical protein